MRRAVARERRRRCERESGERRSGTKGDGCDNPANLASGIAGAAGRMKATGQASNSKSDDELAATHDCIRCRPG